MDKKYNTTNAELSKEQNIGINQGVYDGVDIVEHIKALCQQRGLTYYRLAVNSGIPHSTLNAVLHKRNMPSLTIVLKICGGLGIQPSEFFAGLEQMTKLGQRHEQSTGKRGRR